MAVRNKSAPRPNLNVSLKVLLLKVGLKLMQELRVMLPLPHQPVVAEADHGCGSQVMHLVSPILLAVVNLAINASFNTVN